MSFVLEQGNWFNQVFLIMHIHTLIVHYSSCAGIIWLHSVCSSVCISVRLYVTTWNRKIVYDHELISCNKVLVVHFMKDWYMQNIVYENVNWGKRRPFWLHFINVFFYFWPSVTGRWFHLSIICQTVASVGDMHHLFLLYLLLSYIR